MPDNLAPAARPSQPDQDRFVGCLLGGAVGDALGAPVEFMSRSQILDAFGPSGITDYAPAYGGVGTITDDTQMTLFTAEGLIRAEVRGQSKGITTYAGVTAHAYLRWLQTQGEQHHDDVELFDPGWLTSHRELHSRRAPGLTCVSALREMNYFGAPAVNSSKGCGGVMRIAPVGLYGRREGTRLKTTFDRGVELAALTHGHPTGSLPAGVLAVLVHQLVGDASMTDALSVATDLLRSEPDHAETLTAISNAVTLAHSNYPYESAIAELGQGWVAEEALAIAIYCALVAEDFEHGVVLAVNHDGDSDSTGSIVGNLLGAICGTSAIPQRWLAPLELREVIAEVAGDLYACRDWNVSYSDDREFAAQIFRKYPGD